MTTPTSDRFIAISRDREQAARAWKIAGGKVVGYLSNNVPVEIIHAAGMLPFHLNGNPQGDNALADQYMEPAFDPLTRSIFDRLLRGEFDFLDAIVLPRSNDAQQRLYYYLCELKRQHSRFELPPVYLVDILHSPKESTTRHNELKVREYAAFIEQQSGTRLDDKMLAASIADYNLARERLENFNAMRAAPEVDISSELAHAVYAAARSLPIKDFNPLLQELLEELKDREAEPSLKRFVIAGNGLDHPALHNWADALGARIVGDYHSFGNHFLSGRVDASLPPLQALAHNYEKSKSCRSFFDRPDDVVQFARQQNASGILFFYIKREEALTWHYPQQNKAARDAGLPTLALQRQDYQLDTDANLNSMQEFLESL